MKNSLCLLLVLPAILAMAQPKPGGKTIVLTNSSTVNLTNKPVTLARTKLSSPKNVAYFPEVRDESNQPIPAQ